MAVPRLSNADLKAKVQFQQLILTALACVFVKATTEEVRHVLHTASTSDVLEVDGSN